MAQTGQPKPIDAADLPLRVSESPGVPAYVQLAQQLEVLITSRILRVGAKLPSTRALANALGVNRNTIVAAFESLSNAGLVETRGRAGTIVSGLSTLSAPATSKRAVAGLGVTARPVTEPRSGTGTIDFRLGPVDPSPLPVEVWRRACREAGRHLPRADYGDPRGEADLRGQIALYLGRTRALRVDPEQVLITAGAGQAIERIAEAVLRRNDYAALEDPGYPRAARAFRRAGAELMPIAVDDDGIDSAMLSAQSPRPRLVHVTPSHQYPLGARLSAARRELLIGWAATYDVLIIENDYDGEFRYGSPPLPSLASLAGLHNVAYVGTFSKVLSPAIRLGFFIGPQNLIEPVMNVVAETRDPVSAITQRIVTWLIRTGELEKHIRRTRRQYAARRATMLQCLSALPSVASVTGQAAGLHVVVSLRDGVARDALLARLRKFKVAVDCVADFCLRERTDDRLLLAYGHLNEQQIVDGVKRLGRSIRAA